MNNLMNNLKPIYPIGLKIIDHPNLNEWERQGYVRQESNGLWLHYSVVCTLLTEQACERAGRE